MSILRTFGSWRRLSFIAILFVLVIAAIGARYLTARAAAPRQQAPASAAVPVTAAVAVREDVPDTVSALGTVQSIDSVAVQPRVGGAIVKIEFTPGQDVKKDQELFLIDPRPYQAALDQSKAQLAHDEAVLEEAQVDLTRYQTLAQQNSIAKQQAEDQVYVVQQDKGTVALDQANVETAQLNLNYCHVTAPISGRTGVLLVDLGNLVGPASTQSTGGTATSTSGTSSGSTSSGSLVSIAQLQPIYVTFNVPQTLLGEILRNQAAGKLEVDAYSQSGTLLEKGSLTLIDNQVNTSTGTVMMQGRFANADDLLWPGEFVRVNLIVSIRKNVVTVPTATVMAGPDGPYVYVIGSDQTVKRVSVQVAARQGAIAVISQGLSGGEKVVTDGQYRLDNGSKVNVRSTTEAG